AARPISAAGARPPRGTAVGPGRLRRRAGRWPSPPRPSTPRRPQIPRQFHAKPTMRVSPETRADSYFTQDSGIRIPSPSRTWAAARGDRGHHGPGERTPMIMRPQRRLLLPTATATALALTGPLAGAALAASLTFSTYLGGTNDEAAAW